MGLEEEVKRRALELGADLVGICAVEEVEDRNPSLLPRASSCVVFLCGQSEAALLSDLRMAQYDTYCTYQKLGLIGRELARLLEDRGFPSLSVPTALPLDMGEGKFGLRGEFSLRHAAVAAGLGELGLSRLLVTERFGPRVRIGGVLTEAPLRPDGRKLEGICRRCGRCLKACPVGAIEEGRKVDVFRCAVNLLRYGPPGAAAFLSELAGKGAEERSQLTFDPTFLNLWQTTTLGTFYHCFECVKACPVGRIRPTP
jgi:epoxyqueuosine reductase QueG